MTRAIVFGTLLLWALAAGAQARDWGFDKDTVYEWKAGGDTVGLVNNGTDTLRLDSVYAQEVNSQNWYHVRFYYRDQLGFTVEDWEPHTSIRIDSIPPNKTLYLRNFSVANILTKRAAESSALAEGDTLRVRLRFKSLGGEADTLMVVGILGGITPIRFTPYRPRTLEEGFVGRDILGRTVTSPTRFPALIRTPGK